MRVVLSLTLGLVLVVAGCSSQQQRTSMSGRRQSELNRFVAEDRIAELHAELFSFADRFAAEVSGKMTAIAAETTDRSLREATLRARLATIPAMRQAVYLQTPRMALLDAWIIAVQLHDFAQRPVTSGVQGEIGEAVEPIFRAIEADIESIAKAYVEPDEFETVKELVMYLAGTHPLRRTSATVMRDADLRAAARDAGIESVLSIPIAGVSQGATAIDRVANVAAAMTEVVEDLPQVARWHAELLLFEMEQLPSVQTTRDSLERLSIASASLAESSTSLAETARAMPAELREQIGIALDDFDESSAALRTTISDIRTTAETIDVSLARLDAIVPQAESLVAEVRDAGEVWAEAARAVDETITELNKLIPERTPEQIAAAADEPGGLERLQRTAEGLQAAATDLRGLLNELDSSRLQEMSRPSIDHVGVVGTELVDRLTTRGLLLIGVFFVGLIAYRVTTSRLARS